MEYAGVHPLARALQGSAVVSGDMAERHVGLSFPGLGPGGGPGPVLPYRRRASGLDASLYPVPRQRASARDGERPKPGCFPPVRRPGARFRRRRPIRRSRRWFPSTARCRSSRSARLGALCGRSPCGSGPWCWHRSRRAGYCGAVWSALAYRLPAVRGRPASAGRCPEVRLHGAGLPPGTCPEAAGGRLEMAPRRAARAWRWRAGQGVGASRRAGALGCTSSTWSGGNAGLPACSAPAAADR